MYLKKSYLELPRNPITFDLEVPEIYWEQAHQVAQQFGTDQGLLAITHIILNTGGYRPADVIEHLAFDTDLSNVLDPSSESDWLRIRARFLKSCLEEGYAVRDILRIPEMKLITLRGHAMDEMDSIPRGELS